MMQLMISITVYDVQGVTMILIRRIFFCRKYRPVCEHAYIIVIKSIFASEEIALPWLFLRHYNITLSTHPCMISTYK